MLLIDYPFFCDIALIVTVECLATSEQRVFWRTASVVRLFIFLRSVFLFMALIKCPECGKERVSNTAEKCPDCGFAIARYVKQEQWKIKNEEEKARIAEKEIEEYEKLKPEMERVMREIDNMPLPQKPSYLKMFFTGDGKVLSWLAIIVFVILIILIASIPSGANLLFILLLIADIMFLIFWAAIGYGDYKSFLSQYEKEISPSYKEEQKEKIKREYKTIAHNLAAYGTRTIPNTNRNFNFNSNTNTLKCPVCNSTNVKRLSNLNRGVSVAAWGVASSKIGKQYECNKCKHKW